MPWFIGVTSLLVVAVVVLILLLTVFKGDGGGETAVSGPGFTETSEDAAKDTTKDNGKDSGRDTAHDLIGYEGMLVPLSLAYPRGWKLDEDPDGHIEVWPKDEKEEVLLFIYHDDLTDYEYSLDDWVDETAINLDEMGLDFEVSSTKIDGYPASKFTYVEGQVDTTDYKVMLIFTMKDGIAYVVKYICEETAYERYLKDAAKVIESIELL